jgi:hypothetical protein
MLLALNLGDAGKLDEMLMLKACNDQHNAAADSALYDDLFNQEINKMAEGVPDDVKQAAQARGREMSLRVAAQDYLYSLFGIDKRLGDWPVIHL